MKGGKLWRELTESLQEHYRIVERRPFWIGLIYEGAGCLRVRVELAEVDEGPCVRVLADVAPVDNMPLEDAMSLNLGLAVGAYALEGRRIVLRAGAMLDGSAVAIVPELIERLGREAARCRAVVYREPPDASELLELFPAD